MWSLRNILVPTDFSDPSAVALDRAIDLARPFSASITLLHVYEVNIYGAPMGPLFAPIELISAVEQAAQHALADILAAHKTCGVTITSVLREGNAAPTILSVAREFAADLITMGTHGRHGLSRALLGSVTERVVRTSSIPVLVAHSGESGLAETRAEPTRPVDTHGEPIPKEPASPSPGAAPPAPQHH